MAKRDNELMLPDELVMNKIYLIRGQKVMLDRDLATLCGRNKSIKSGSQKKYRKIS